MEFPTSELQHRYRIARSAVYNRLEQLGITPQRVGRKSFLSAAQLQLMDELHHFIQQGGDGAEFARSKGIKPKAKAMGQEASVAYLRVLEDASSNGWLLKTSELAALLNLAAEQLEVKASFSDAGFVFIQKGYRGNGERAWKVVKPSWD